MGWSQMRRWVPGFRSGRPWKSAIAVVFYACLLLFLIVAAAKRDITVFSFALGWLIVPVLAVFFWSYRRVPRVNLALGAGIVVVAIATCGVAAITAPPSKPTANARPETAAATPRPAKTPLITPTPTAARTTTAPTARTQTPAPAPPITGFGATDASWNVHHTADPDFAPGSVYNADPNLPKINGHTGAHYVAVIHSNGRVLAYTMNLLPGTSIDAARKITLQEFPSDVSVVWFSVKDTCAQMEVKSPSLGAALHDPTDLEGMAMVELDTEHADGTADYDPKNINHAFVVDLDYATPADAGAC